MHGNYNQPKRLSAFFPQKKLSEKTYSEKTIFLTFLIACSRLLLIGDEKWPGDDEWNLVEKKEWSGEPISIFLKT